MTVSGEKVGRKKMVEGALKTNYDPALMEVRVSLLMEK